MKQAQLQALVRRAQQSTPRPLTPDEAEDKRIGQLSITVLERDIRQLKARIAQDELAGYVQADDALRLESYQRQLARIKTQLAPLANRPLPGVRLPGVRS